MKTGKIPNNIGFPAGFPTSTVNQDEPVRPEDYGKQMIDKHGRTYLQTPKGKIY